MKKKLSLSSNSGSVAIEFVFIVPLLLIVMAGLFEFGRYLWIQHDIYNMIRSGTQYLFNNGYDFSNVNSVMLNASNLNGDSNLTINTIQCGCATSSTDTISWATCSTVDCSSSKMGYVKIGAIYQYTPFFGSVPEISNLIPKTISATSQFRIQ